MNLSRINLKFSSLQRQFTISTFLFTLVALQIIKSGIHPIGTDWIDWLRSAGKALPNYDSYLSKSIFPAYLSRVLPQNNYFSWWLFYSIILVIWISFVHNWINKRFKGDAKIVQVLFFMLPGTISQFLFLGHYDIFIFIFSILAVASSALPLAFLGIIVCSFTNPEMTIVIGANLLLVCLLIRSRKLLIIALGFLMFSTLTILTERLFFREVKPDRVSINLDLWLPTFKTALPIWQLHLWALISPILIGVLIYFEGRLFKRDLLLLIPCMIVPLFFSMIIVDGTRVGAVIGSSAIVASFLHFAERSSKLHSNNGNLFVRLFFIWLIVPIISVDVGGLLRLPYQVLLSTLIK